MTRQMIVNKTVASIEDFRELERTIKLQGGQVTKVTSNKYGLQVKFILGGD